MKYYAQVFAFLATLLLFNSCSQYAWIDSTKATKQGKSAHNKRIKELKRKQPGKRWF